MPDIPGRVFSPDQHDNHMAGAPRLEQKSQTNASQTDSLLAAMPLIAPLIAIYIVSQFMRNSTGVIAPDIARDLSLRPEALGVLSSAFFLTFAAAQIPVGAVIDRFGPKAAMLGSLSLAIAGAAMFGFADTLAGLTIARALMGLGCSTLYVAPLSLYARTFAPERFANLVGLQLGVGTLGALLATAPLAYAAAAIGWRASFWVVAAITIAIGAVVAVLVPHRRPGDTAPQSILHSFSGFGEVVRIPGVWPLFAINLASYSAFVTIIGLWGAPFLADIHGLGIEARGNVLFAMAAAQIAGVLGWGAIDRRFATRKRPVMVGASVTIATLTALAAAPTLPLAGITALLALVAIAGAYAPILVAHGKELFPPHLVGRGITLLNLANMGGVFVLQMATALVIGWLDAGDPGGPHPLIAYRAMFLVVAGALALAVACYASAPEGGYRDGN